MLIHGTHTHIQIHSVLNICWAGTSWGLDTCMMYVARMGKLMVGMAANASFSLSCRWLAYLLLLIMDLVICLAVCLGMAKHSQCLLIT